MKFARSAKHPAAWAKGGLVLVTDCQVFSEVPPLEFSPTFDIEHTEYSGNCNTAFRMDRAESERIHELCSRIAVEQDRQEFLKLCEELNRILTAKHERLQNGKTGSQEDD
jgi:hypothetical protein